MMLISIDTLAAAEQRGFRRGAEDMRERATDLAQSIHSSDASLLPDVIARRIRSLTIEAG